MSLNYPKKMMALFMMTLIILMSCPVHADPIPNAPDLTEGEIDVGEAISPMKKGQKAPFTGVLLSPRAIAKITIELKSFDEKISVERENSQQICEANCQFKLQMQKIESQTDLKILTAKLETAKEQNTLLQERLKKIESEQPNVELWTAGGAIVGIITTIAIVFAVSKAQSTTN